MTKAEISQNTLHLLEQIPMPIVIHHKGIIVDCNSAALEIASALEKKTVVGETILRFLTEESQGKALKFIANEETYNNELFQLIDIKGDFKDIEIKKNYFEDSGNKFTFLILTDVTEYHKGLRNAARIQEMTMVSDQSESLGVEKVFGYYPKQLVSGDFHYTNQYDASHMLGILGDVKGKGISAALSTSALKILFYESCSNNYSTRDMAASINHGVKKFLGEEYVAAIIFRFDLDKSEVSITSAGIHEFLIYNSNTGCVPIALKGPYLGMLDQDLFDHCNQPFKEGTEVYFYSDGYEDYSAREITQRVNDALDFEGRISVFKELAKGPSHDDMTFVAFRRSENGK